MSGKNNNNNNGGDKNNNFFNNNPLLVFVVFSIVTIFVFKALFPEGTGQSITGQISSIASYGKTVNQTIAYSDLKKMISNGNIEYVGIGNTQIKAIGKPTNGQTIAYTARRVVPDTTLIPSLEAKGINYGGISEENIIADILGWILPFVLFFAVWMFLAKRMSKSMGGGSGGILGIGSSLF